MRWFNNVQLNPQEMSKQSNVSLANRLKRQCKTDLNLSDRQPGAVHVAGRSPNQMTFDRV